MTLPFDPLRDALADRRHDEEAIRQFRQAVAMEPHFESAQTWLAVAPAALGREEEALANARRSYEITVADPPSDATLALVNAMLGRTAVAEGILVRELPALTPFPFFVAFTYPRWGGTTIPSSGSNAPTRRVGIRCIPSGGNRRSSDTTKTPAFSRCSIE